MFGPCSAGSSGNTTLRVLEEGCKWQLHKFLCSKASSNGKRPPWVAVFFDLNGHHWPPKRVLLPGRGAICSVRTAVGLGSGAVCITGPGGFWCIGLPALPAAPIRTLFPLSLEQVVCQTENSGFLQEFCKTMAQALFGYSKFGIFLDGAFRQMELCRALCRIKLWRIIEV